MKYYQNTDAVSELNTLTGRERERERDSGNERKRNGILFSWHSQSSLQSNFVHNINNQAYYAYTVSYSLCTSNFNLLIQHKQRRKEKDISWMLKERKK